MASDPPRTFPLRNLGCTGQYVVVLATRIDASTPLRSIEGIMAGFDSPAEHAQYAESSGSCSNLGAIRGKGAARWIPYFGAFDDGGSACRARAAHADSTTYVVRLDEGATDAVFCACVTETSALPVLTPQNAGRPPRDLMLWVLGLQYMLRDAGYPPSALTGNYLGSTTQRVTELQRDGGLPPTGDVDADTWDALKRRLCPPGS